MTQKEIRKKDLERKVVPAFKGLLRRLLDRMRKIRLDRMCLELSQRKKFRWDV